MDYDTYLARQVENHMNQDKMNAEVSNCCGSDIMDETDICLKCLEHCEVVTYEEYLTRKYEIEMEDKADAERELR